MSAMMAGVLAALFLAGCAAQGAGPGSGPEQIRLPIGRTARTADGGLTVRFEAVSEDSRCPKGDQCIRAGEARVALVLEAPGGKPESVELSLGGEPSEVSYGGWTLRLEAVDPEPVSGRPVERENYSATLTVGKNIV